MAEASLFGTANSGRLTIVEILRNHALLNIIAHVINIYDYRYPTSLASLWVQIAAQYCLTLRNPEKSFLSIPPW